MKKLIFIFLIIVSYKWVGAIEITINYRNGASELRYYSGDTENLKFLLGTARNGGIIEIIGLENFPNLKELWFGMTAFINDYDFLKKLNTIEVLVFQDIRFSNIDFLYNLASLKRVVFQSCRIANNKIDASKLPNLEYIEFTNSRLIEFPIEVREKQKLETINVSYNDIINIPIDRYIDIQVIAWRNPIQNLCNKNIKTGNGDRYYSIVPEKYRQYVR